MSDATNANIPQPSASFLIGRPEPISPVWWAFLLALFERTGGNGTPTPVKQIDYTPLIDAQVPFALFAPDEGAPAPVGYPLASADAPPDPVSVPYVPSDPVEDIFIDSTLPNPNGYPTFVAGVTTTLTVSKVYTSAAAVLLHFDASFQGTDQYGVSGNKINLTSAIPVGISKVYARG